MSKKYIPAALLAAVIALGGSALAAAPVVSGPDVGGIEPPAPLVQAYFDCDTQETRFNGEQFLEVMGEDSGAYYHSDAAVTYSDAEVVSVVRSTETYMGGAASDRYFTGYVLDRQGRRLTLQDYWQFQNPAELCEIVYQEAKAQLDADGRYYEDVFLREWAQKPLENFYLDGDGMVHAYIHPYEVNLAGHESFAVTILP